MAEVEWEPVCTLADQVRRGERSATDVLAQALAAIEAGNEALNAFVHVDVDVARAAADAVDACVADGRDPGPLAGVPFGVKDLEDCAGMPTSYGSLLFKGRGPVAHDSVHVARMRAAGAVPVGKTAAPEFGTFNFTRTKAWGTTRNPWDWERTPGGSSGGSAAAVAAGLVPLATASDGGGSTRIPAGFSGLVGFKPSHGRIPHPGPPVHRHRSAGCSPPRSPMRLGTSTGRGPDDRDRTSLPGTEVVYERAVEELEVAGVRARWSLDLGFAAVDPEVTELTTAAAGALAAAAGLAMDDDPVQLTDPVRTWLSNGVSTCGSRSRRGRGRRWPMTSASTPHGPRADRGHDRAAPGQGHAPPGSARLDVAALFEEVEVLVTPTTAVPASWPRGRPRRSTAARCTRPCRRLHDVGQPVLEPIGVDPGWGHQRRPPCRPHAHGRPPPRRPRPTAGPHPRAIQPCPAGRHSCRLGSKLPG
ncbi:MAG: amidase [Acidimicrobiales bacterium]